MKELIEYIAKSLVDHPDSVKVTEVEGERTSVIELSVVKEDLGKVIGKQGKTARAMRTILSAASTKEKKRTIISNGIVLIYLFLEILLDYVFQIPFREMLAIHVPYIVVFYAALFSMMAVSFEKNKRMGYVVIATFWVLIGCLIYNLLPI